jgi:hypothetical protein
MSDLYLDPATNDLDVTAGVIRLTSGNLETAAQRLRLKLRTFLGEWFLNANVGVPYYQSILGVKNPDLAPIRTIFYNVLQSDDLVDSIPKLELSFASRILSVDCDVYIINDEVAEEGVTVAPTVLVPIASQNNPLIWFF